MKRHPIRTGGIVAALLILLDVLLLPWWTLASYRTQNPTTTAFQQTYLDQQSRSGKRAAITQSWVPLARVSDDLKRAVIVAEDGSFWSHGGFDWYEFRESVLRNIREGRAARGASTITQQLVKNLFLSSSKNPVRKFNEWILTWTAEQLLTKNRILELYLNVIEWGPGIYGIEAAARSTYGCSAGSLDRRQSARLAAVIPNPRRFRPLSGSRYVERRTELILLRMNARDRARGRVEVPEIPEADALSADTTATSTLVPQ